MIVELARGGMGDVFLAVSRGPGGFHKLVVIKELRASLATDNEFLHMFMAEARISARLHHPNIVQTNEVGQEGNRYFMAMEYLEGQTLQRCLQRIPRTELSLGMQLRILVDILNGLHYAHELTDYDGKPLHVVHRDISPHNILITYDGQPKILDFGIAKTRDSAQNTATGVLKGKIPYMAPEQLDRNHDLRVDVFAVGVMAWEAIAGRRMWAAKTDPGIVQALAEGKIPSLREARPDVPEDIERIVTRALAPDREARYQTAQELAVDLEAYISANGIDVLPKQIARLVTKTFEHEREQIRSVIEAQLRTVEEAGEDAPSDDRMSIPRLNLGHTDQTPSGESRGRSGQTPSGALVHGQASAVTTTGARSPRIMAVAILTALAGAGVTAAFLTRPRPTGASTAPAASSVESAPATAAGPQPIEVVISAMPANAVLYLDDAPLDANPYKGHALPGGTHHIRAEAPGYVAAEAARAFDGDVVVTLALEKAKPDSGARAAAPIARPTPHQPPPRPAPTASAPHPSPTTHTIDPSDPYSK